MEADGAESKKDFQHKISIFVEEGSKTYFDIFFDSST